MGDVFSAHPFVKSWQCKYYGKIPDNTLLFFHSFVNDLKLVPMLFSPISPGKF